MSAREAPEVVDGAVRREALDGGAIWRLWLSTPKANVIDGAKIAALTAAFRAVREESALKCVILQGEGPNFSFGASVEEHLPGRFEGMLTAFHGLFRTMLQASVPTVAVVRGQCLGGGLELASFCTRVCAAPDARLGQPEIRLGVVAPLASFYLPERIGRAAAEDLCLSGRSVGAPEALALGLVDEVGEDPEQLALDWIRARLVPHSAASLRHAQRTLRLELERRFDPAMARAEQLYRDDLMSTADAREGLRAFLEKRPPQWRNA